MDKPLRSVYSLIFFIAAQQSFSKSKVSISTKQFSVQKNFFIELSLANYFFETEE